MLTNFETISKRVSKMQEYERMKLSGEFDAMPKKEALLLSRELEKLQKNLGGIRSMQQRPDAVFILDTKKEHIAVTEANKLKIPVIAVVDTNVDPDIIQFPIPGNDDAIRANALMSRVIAEAVEEGRYISSRRNPPAAPKRTAEEDAEFAATQADARRQAAAAQADREARLAAAQSAPSTDESSAVASGAAAATEAADAAVAVVESLPPVGEIDIVEPAAGTASGEASPDAATPETATPETARPEVASENTPEG
jgi:small subunit ribosomal protein S2